MKNAFLNTSLSLTISLLLLAASRLGAATLHVSSVSTSPTPPYADWATAATNIQDAVNAAAGGDTVLVTNGVYSGGISVTNPLALLSVNGPLFTVIDGAAAVRCVSLTNGASLAGFTLTNGTDNIGSGGGGVWCASTNAVVTNCVITGNSAFGGGGAAGGTLYFCTLTGNSGVYGGGAAGCNLNNCTLVGNGASYGGGADASDLNNCLVVSNIVNATGAGAFDSTLVNCTIWGNTAFDGTGGMEGCVAQNCIILANDPWNQSLCSVDRCCSSPLADGFGNIDVDPALMNPSAGDFHLQTNSPCINSGNNAWVTGATDLDSNRRIVSDTVDIGAYEYQGGGSVISYAWLQQYGLPTDGSADYTDPDHDGLNNRQEWICGTSPTNSLSVLRLVSAVPVGGDVTVTWQSVAGVSYFLECSTNLAVSSAFTRVATNLPGQPDISTYTHANAAGAGTLFYRVGVDSP
jgi:hypothetical protein